VPETSTGQPSAVQKYCEECGERERSWMRHCATSLKVAGSIPDDIIGFFN
jgi:hypothetical protein